MSHMNLKMLFVAAAIGLASPVSIASTIWLEPVGPTNIPQGGSIVLSLWGNAADVGGFLGGGVWALLPPQSFQR